VAFALADVHDALARSGMAMGPVLAVGGGARSEPWLRIIAAATGLTLLIPESADVGAAYGAAKLARACLSPGFDAGQFTPPPIRATITPDPALAAAYTPRRARFRQLYAAINGAQHG
jgi:xylulokinase